MATAAAARRWTTVAAVAWLMVVLSIDIVFARPDLVVAGLLAMAPLIACTALSAPSTAALGVAAVGLTVASGWWTDTWATSQQKIRIVDVVLVSVAAVVIAAIRVRRERSLIRVAAIAEAAERAILPILPGRAGNVRIAARYQSAAQDALVGGDLYDGYQAGSRTRLLVGDVRGKGLSGVEQAARTIRAFRQSAATQPTLATVATDMDSYLVRFFDEEEFVTAVLVEIEGESDALTLLSCGHPHPVLAASDGTSSYVDLPSGRPLGLGGGAEEATVVWAVGDRLLLYTDGLSEARDRRAEFLDPLTLAPLLRTEPLDGALEQVVAAVRRHVASGELTDDMAVVLLENTDPNELPPPSGDAVAGTERSAAAARGAGAAPPGAPDAGMP